METIIDEATREKSAEILAFKKWLWEIAESKEVLLVVLTGLGYLSAYMFDRAALSVYGIPAQFISIGLQDIIIGVVVTVIASLLIYMSIIDSTDKKRLRFKRVIWVHRITFSVFYLSLLLFAFQPNFNNIIKLTLLSTAIVGATYIIGLIINFILYKNIKQVLKMNPLSWGRSPHPVESKGALPFSIALYFLAVFFVGILAFVAGKGYARMQTNYPVLGTDGKYKNLVINVNADQFLVAKYDTSAHKFSGKYYFVDTTSAHDIETYVIDNSK